MNSHFAVFGGAFAVIFLSAICEISTEVSTIYSEYIVRKFHREYVDCLLQEVLTVLKMLMTI